MNTISKENVINE